MVERKEIYKAIDDEREHQNRKWGEAFDKLNTPNDWVAYLAAYVGKAVTLPWNPDTFRTAVLKVAALCVAILERDTYSNRHYDEGGLKPSDNF